MGVVGNMRHLCYAGDLDDQRQRAAGRRQHAPFLDLPGPETAVLRS
jgi:hypothetical protein